MSWSNGPGSPINFQCSKCRRRWAMAGGYRPDSMISRRGMRDRVELTGRKRQARPNHGSVPGLRSDRFKREYKCLDCGHVGWSNHIDLKHKEKMNERDRTQ